jgi:hypothetical protein
VIAMHNGVKVILQNHPRVESQSFFATAEVEGASEDFIAGVRLE